MGKEKMWVLRQNISPLILCLKINLSQTLHGVKFSLLICLPSSQSPGGGNPKLLANDTSYLYLCNSSDVNVSPAGIK